MTDDLTPETIEPDETTEVPDETSDTVEPDAETSDTVEPDAETTDAPDEEEADNLASLPPERLAKLLREKRAAEASARGRLRDADAEIARLTETARAAQRGQVAEAANRLRALPTAVADVVDRIDITSVLGEDGSIDREKLNDAIEALFVTRPHWKMPKVSTRSGPGIAGGESGYEHSRLREQKATWSDVLSQ
ncbi:hypothetical protein SAMN06295885_2528 [Rathayibacter oskolensis]|uniref:Scaffolding protein n=1 Tax=Rathayibacter oskolensis TaxID=1891671 RepID=A0A1X7P3R2_9MICO|nr:hypothetical protein [Rathayibacter oskolensis]SMH45387.1 hypothetical protein SAMN06295885_2528 [Rathayibacter oskolensis]